MWPAVERGNDHQKIQTTATTPASVGVNQPVRMPPSRMTGIISGSEASLTATSDLAKRRARPLHADRTEEIAIDHQAEADHHARARRRP